MRRAPFLITCLLMSAVACTLFAHDGPHDAIALINHKMEAEGASARLLIARADEHLILGDSAFARRDYLKAYELDRNSTGALMGLARTSLEAHEHEQAIKWAQFGVEATRSTGYEPVFHAMTARAHTASGQHADAYMAWSSAIDTERPQAEWLIAHAEVARLLQGDQAALEALTAAREKNPSILIERAQIALLVEMGQTNDARKLLEPRGAPRGASQLLLWAKLLSSEGDKKAALNYLDSAIHQWSSQTDRMHSNPVVEADLAEAIRWRETHFRQP